MSRPSEEEQQPVVNERVAYLNGELVPESEAQVSIRDAGFLYGDAVFDTTRTFGHRIFRLQEHIDRLYDSLTYMRIDPGLTKQETTGLTAEVLKANLPLLDDDDDYWVSQRFTRGIIGRVQRWLGHRDHRMLPTSLRRTSALLP